MLIHIFNLWSSLLRIRVAHFSNSWKFTLIYQRVQNTQQKKSLRKIEKIAWFKTSKHRSSPFIEKISHVFPPGLVFKRRLTEVLMLVQCKLYMHLSNIDQVEIELESNLQATLEAKQMCRLYLIYMFKSRRSFDLFVKFASFFSRSSPRLFCVEVHIFTRLSPCA
jgi:hypothetical protein